MKKTNPDARLWAVTCYFNPQSYRRRRVNYHHFRTHLGIPLACIEISYDGHWELNAEDADILVQLPARDIMWQKERLLNVILDWLPERCTQVAYLDCDVIFQDPHWPEQAELMLDQFAMIQLFRDVHYMPADWKPDPVASSGMIRTRHSLMSCITSGRPAEACLVHPSPEQRPGTFNNGLAWAARRDLLAHHGLFDANIIGGGDRAITCAALGTFQHAMQWHRMGKRHQAYYMDWALPFHKAVHGEVSCLDGGILHLWHGDAQRRGHGVRHARLAEFDFDPYVDIAIDDHGCWRWNSRKPDMHRFVRAYFASRKEDG